MLCRVGEVEKKYNNRSCDSYRERTKSTRKFIVRSWGSYRIKSTKKRKILTEVR